MGKRQILIVTLLSITIIVGSFAMMSLFSNLKKDVPKKKESFQQLFYVKTSPVTYSKKPIFVTGYGKVLSILPLDIVSEVQGKMIKGSIPLREGQSFRKGDLLFRIDNTELLLDMQSQRSNLLRDIAGILPDLKIDFPDRFPIWEAYINTLSIDKSLSELPEASSNKEKTFLSVKGIYSTYYSIKRQEFNLQKHRIKAPFTGSIVEINSQVGSYVNPGTKVIKILETGRLEVKIDVDLDDVKWIKPNMKVLINSENRDKKWDGRVDRIGKVIQDNTQSIGVYVSIISNRSYPIYEGMYLQSVIECNEMDSVMEILRTSIIDNNKVYLLQDSLLVLKDIDIHRFYLDKVFVSGIEEGTELVIDPPVGAYPNMKVLKI